MAVHGAAVGVGEGETFDTGSGVIDVEAVAAAAVEDGVVGVAGLRGEGDDIRECRPDLHAEEGMGAGEDGDAAAVGEVGAVHGFADRCEGRGGREAVVGVAALRGDVVVAAEAGREGEVRVHRDGERVVVVLSAEDAVAPAVEEAGRIVRRGGDGRGGAGGDPLRGGARGAGARGVGRDEVLELPLPFEFAPRAGTGVGVLVFGAGVAEGAREGCGIDGIELPARADGAGDVRELDDRGRSAGLLHAGGDRRVAVVGRDAPRAVEGGGGDDMELVGVGGAVDGDGEARRVGGVVGGPGKFIVRDCALAVGGEVVGGDARLVDAALAAGARPGDERCRNGGVNKVGG